MLAKEENLQMLGTMVAIKKKEGRRQPAPFLFTSNIAYMTRT
jgi:hypothetical protein